MSGGKNIVPSILTEFLEIAIHTILKIRQIYPDTIFVKRHKYDVLVYQCIYPELQEYIANCMRPVYQMAKEGRATKIVICFTDGQRNVLENIVFDILLMKDMLERDPILLEIERNFRSFFNRIHAMNSYLDPLQEDVTFSIKIHATESYVTSYIDDLKNQNFPWISSNVSTTSKTYQIVPLESVNSKIVKLQVYAEKKV